MNSYSDVKKKIARGWNTWNTRSVLSHVLTPEGFAVNLCIKDYRNGAYLKEAYIGQFGDHDEKIVPGPHAYDGSYTELKLKWNDIEISVQSATDNNDLVILVTQLHTEANPAALIIESGMLWNREGLLKRDGDAITALLPDNKVNVYAEGTPVFEANIPVQTPYLSMKLAGETGVSTGRKRSIEEIKAVISRNKDKLLNEMKKYGKHAEAYKAMQTCMAWDTIFEPEKERVISTVSRMWNRNWGGYVMFCWDNYFAAYIASLDSKELAYSNAVEMTREMTESGFVPNYAAVNDIKSRDRSQPPVGSMVVHELYRRYREKWFLEEVFDDLYKWNNWFYNNRQVEDGLLTWGSNPFKPTIRRSCEMGGVNERFGAALESGLDNSPMYDDIGFDTEAHMLRLADVGLTGLYIMDCHALSDIALVLGRTAEANELAQRAKQCSASLSTLWDEKAGMFLNKHTDSGDFSNHLSPTNFYALFSREIDKKQLERMIDEHFYNPEEFWGEWILPSIARNDPAYPGEYWRGRIWAPMNFLVYLALRQHGLEKAQKDLADKSEKLILKEWLEFGHVHENYDPETGVGCNSLHSDRFYHWGGLLSLIALIEAGYADAPEKALEFN